MSVQPMIPSPASAITSLAAPYPRQRHSRRCAGRGGEQQTSAGGDGQFNGISGAGTNSMGRVSGKEKLASERVAEFGQSLPWKAQETLNE